MPIWPFRKPLKPNLSIEEIRALLIDAAGSPGKKLRSLCRLYKTDVAANLDYIAKFPDGLAKTPQVVEPYLERLAAVARCLANDCGSPELWHLMTSVPEDYEGLDRWYSTGSTRRAGSPRN